MTSMTTVSSTTSSITASSTTTSSATKAPKQIRAAQTFQVFSLTGHDCMDDISLFGDQDDLSDESQPHQGQALFEDIVALSDEEAVVPPVEPVVPHEGRRKRQKTVESRDLEIASERLNLVVRSNCKRKNPDCRVPFREPHEFEKLLKLRMKLQGMEKQVMDQDPWIFKKVKGLEWVPVVHALGV